MRWYHYVAYFFGGAFLANALPHLGNGISGHAFQSPFASPPGVGLSSSVVNVAWGLFNLAIGYLLVCRVGSFDLRKTAARAGPRGRHPDHVAKLCPLFREAPRRAVRHLPRICADFHGSKGVS
jgi:hypothetical protein